MTLEEAIKHAEEVAEEQDKLCKRYDDASGYSRSHNEAIRTTDAKRCSKCAKDHRQLAEWLKELKQLREQTKCIPKEHGKLIDADKTISNAYEIYSASGTPCIITADQMYAIRKVLTAAQPIIEANNNANTYEDDEIKI